MNKGFTIGEMSRLHNIPIKTLRYYDEIGLFKPHHVDDNNGYRYYTIDQFEQLNTINYLKTLKIPLKKIKEHLRVTQLDDFMSLLDKELILTRQRIKQLQENEKQLLQRMEDIQSTRSYNLGTVYYRTLPKRFAYSLTEDMTTTEEIELTLRHLSNLVELQESIMIGQVGLMIKKEALLQKKYDVFNRLLVYKEEACQSSAHTYVLEEGLYATVLYTGADHKDSPAYYKVLMDSIIREGYTIVGDAIERVIIDEHLTTNPKEFITEIQIPINK